MEQKSDEEFLFDLVYNNDQYTMLERLSQVYLEKYKKVELRKMVVQYGVSSFTEPDCFPWRTPLQQVPNLLLDNKQFFMEIFDRIGEENRMDALFPFLTDLILQKISHLPEAKNYQLYQQLEFLFSHQAVRAYYGTELNFHFLEKIFNPRFCPDPLNFMHIPKDKNEIYEMSKYIDNLFQATSKIILIFCRCKETREKIVQWLFLFVKRNQARKKTQPDLTCSSDGVVLNFLSTMFLLCEPFMIPHSEKAKKVSLTDINHNFMSQCFEITQKMVDYGFLTVFQRYRIFATRFKDDKEKENILAGYQAQLCNKFMLSYLKRFTTLHLFYLSVRGVTDDERMESVWKVLDFLHHFKLVDIEMENYIIEYYLKVEETKNPHLRAEVGRITAAIVASSQRFPSRELTRKLLMLYGNLQNVDQHEQFLCRREIAKCVERVDLLQMDISIQRDFAYGVLVEVDSLVSSAIDDMKKIKEKLDKKEEIEEKTREDTKFRFELVYDTMDLLLSLSQKIPSAFQNDYSLKKLASFWSFSIYNLLGPQALNLKVAQPAEYNFDPKRLLQGSIKIFGNLKNQELFDEIGKLGLLDSNIFGKLIRVISRERLFDYGTIQEIKKSLAHVNIVEDEEDAPEEFYDAIMGTIMEIPIKLPSGNHVDRTTILQHLKNDTSDPFTRQALREEDLVIDEDLKLRIVEWRNQK